MKKTYFVMADANKELNEKLDAVKIRLVELNDRLLKEEDDVVYDELEAEEEDAFALKKVLTSSQQALLKEMRRIQKQVGSEEFAAWKVEWHESRGIEQTTFRLEKPCKSPAQKRMEDLYSRY